MVAHGTRRTAESGVAVRLEPAREERLRGLLFEFALGTPSGKTFDENEMVLLRDDITRLLGEIDFLRCHAVRALRDFYQIRDLGDFVYEVRESEGQGWEGPLVRRWSDADQLAKAALKEAS